MSSTLDTGKLPGHIAIIMDGNGRWAKREGVSRARGHEAGADSVRAVVEGCRELGIGCLSLYAFSTENWRRSKAEVSALFRLMSRYVQLELDNLHREDIRVVFMGRRSGLSKKVLADLDHCTEITRANESMVLNIAVNYGARAELADACWSIAESVRDGRLAAEDITEDTVGAHLYQPDLPDVDLLVRTSGEYRLSNFMLWQVSYAEIVVTDVLWPDFRKPDLHDAIVEYQRRHRRFGGR